MKHLMNFKFLFFFLFILAFTSCKKEFEDTTNNPGTVEPSELNPLLTRSTTNGSEDGLDFDCFTVTFPFSLIDNEDGEHVITSNDDFFELFDSSSTVFIVDFAYPLNILLEDGENTIVASGEELGQLFANCLPNGWTDDLFPAYNINDENSCMTLEYPITLQRADNSTVVCANEAALIDSLAIEPLFFAFPMNLLDEDSNVVTVNNIDELLNALFSCNGWGGGIDTSFFGDGPEYIGCYEVVFPFTVILSDGTSVTVNNHMEYCDILLEGELMGFGFPLTLIDLDGNQIVVNSDEELELALEACGNIHTSGGNIILLYLGSLPGNNGDICYELVFPINTTYVNPDGITVNTQINSQDELFALFNDPASNVNLMDVVFPVNVTANGETVTFNGIEEILEFLQSCQ